MTAKYEAKISPVLGEPPGRWAFDGRCGADDVDPQLFFSPNGPDWTEAKLFCDECPVRRECLSYALRTQMLHGTWGGASQVELRRLLQMTSHGNVKKYPNVDLRCPYCRRAKGVTITEPQPKTNDPEIVTCTLCEFTWERPHIKRRGRRKAS